MLTDDLAAGHRERKKLATRAALTAAALRLATDRGPDRVTIEDISAAAGVSSRTFFNYFCSKEEALVGPDPDRAALLREALEQRPEHETPLEALRQAMTVSAATLEADAERWGMRLALVHQHPTLMARYLASFASLERGLIEAVAARLRLDPDNDVYPPLVVAAAVTAMRLAVMRWHRGGGTRRLTDEIDTAFGHLTSGLTAPTPERRRSRPRRPTPAGAR